MRDRHEIWKSVKQILSTAESEQMDPMEGMGIILAAQLLQLELLLDIRELLQNQPERFTDPLTNIPDKLRKQ